MEVVKTELVDLECNVNHFVAVADLLIRRPHLIKSRRKLIAGATILSQESCDFDFCQDGLRFGQSIREKYRDGSLKVEEQNLSGEELDYGLNSVILRDLIYKGGLNLERTECVVWKTQDGQCHLDVVPLQDDLLQKEELCFTKCQHSLTFSAIDHTLTLKVDKRCFTGEENKSNLKWLRWLENAYFNKAVLWLNSKLAPPSVKLISLKLVSLDRFQTVYENLKAKYLDTLVKNWESESTNPEKFISEDLSLAAYLITVWEAEEKRPGSFIDLGCGNGLLVYLLTQEGYKGGVGLDLRRRKIWDFFQKEGTDLRMETFEPEPEPLLRQYEWVIGNHSDELTPWIPLISSLSKSKFFLLPCCHFDFYSRFQRRNSKISIYREYLDFVKNIGERCGFVMEEDRLRIPSTKRICFIGRKMNDNICIEEFLLSIRAKQSTFKPRPVEELVRNCTRVDKIVISDIMKIVLDELLNVKNEQVGIYEDGWNGGGVLDISEVSKAIPAELLAKIKNECGGLQTLFRNHRQVFEVDKGKVRLRIPGSIDNRPSQRKSNKPKTVVTLISKKPCWFFLNHPQGCPLSSEKCNFLHVEQL